MEGGGLPDGRRDDYCHHARRPAHTGILYTPPQWSDHAAVSACFLGVPLQAAAGGGCARGEDGSKRKRRRRDAVAVAAATITAVEAAESDPGGAPSCKTATKLCQPHKKQRPITSFFGAAPRGGGGQAPPTKQKKPPPVRSPPKKKKATISAFFAGTK